MSSVQNLLGDDAVRAWWRRPLPWVLAALLLQHLVRRIILRAVFIGEGHALADGAPHRLIQYQQLMDACAPEVPGVAAMAAAFGLVDGLPRLAEACQPGAVQKLFRRVVGFLAVPA